MTPTVIYVTAGTREEAETIARSLVEARLAACANVLPAITSFFWWEDAVQNDEEVALILKTRQDLVEQVVAKVRELHSYDCPCVVSLPIVDGNRPFLDWIAEETR